jgi:hypothetical protein
MEILSYFNFRLKDFSNVRLGDQLFRRALGLNFPLFQEDDFLGIGNDKINIMFSGENCFPPFSLEVFQDFVDFDLVADIQMGTGFVEEKEGSVLG